MTNTSQQSVVLTTDLRVVPICQVCDSDGPVVTLSEFLRNGGGECCGKPRGLLPPPVTDLCEECEEHPITGLDARCDNCRENAQERAYERSMEETYRGGEAASALAEEQARIQRELK